jgi:hypothetical protein
MPRTRTKGWLSQASRQLKPSPSGKEINLSPKQRNQESFLITTFTTNICRNRYYQMNGAGIRLHTRGEDLNILSLECGTNTGICIVILQSVSLFLGNQFLMNY